MFINGDWNLFDPAKVKKVFTVGKVRVGKSTMLASLAYSVLSGGDAVVVPHLDNISGYQVFAKDWVEAIRDQRFPKGTASEDFHKVEYAIGSSQRSLTPLCFYEASGERLCDFDRLQDDFTGLREHMVDAISNSNIFLLVDEYEVLFDKPSKQDVFFQQFVLDVMKIKNIEGKYGDIGFGLVVTKVDTSFNAQEYAQKAFPATATLLTGLDDALPPKAFPFSVGEVEGEGDGAYISSYDDRHSRELINWIYNTL